MNHPTLFRVHNNLRLRPLRPRQAQAIADIRQAIKDGHKRIILQAPCGFGKTLTAAWLIGGALSKGTRPLFTAPAISLIDQTVKAFEFEGIRDIGVMQAQHERTDREAQVQVASVQTLIKRELPEVDFLMLDECFPAGTQISTPRGMKAIEKITPGELVVNASCTGRVLALSKRLHNTFVKVRLDNGNYFRCTPDHHVFTTCGWKEARLLDVREGIFREEDVSRMRSDIYAADSQGRGSRGKAGIGDRLHQERVLLSILREEDEEPYASRRRARSGITGSSEKRTQAPDSRRKRKAIAGFADPDSTPSGRGVVNRARGKDAEKAGGRLPALLQAGPSESCAADRNRTGRIESSFLDSKRAGSKKGCLAALPRVASVEIEERPRAEPVYNLRVSGHPSYFANGVLVHNCHRSYKGLNEMLDGPWKDKIAIGLTATPWCKGMGLRWTSLIIPATIPQLIEEELLTPTILYVPEQIADRGNIAVQKGEFTEASASQEMRKDRIVGNVVETWKKLGPGDKTFMFCVNLDHARAQMAAFIDSGVPFGYIDAQTPNEERTLQFRKMQHGEIAGIASVGCLIAGVDEDVRCIIDAAPTKSEISLVQRWGRGIRTAHLKSHLLGLDHAANNTDQGLGLFWEIFHDHLDTHKPNEKGVAYEGEKRPAKPRKCAACNVLIPAGSAACKNCGQPVKATGIEHEDGELVVYGTQPKAKKTEREYSMQEKQDWYSGFSGGSPKSAAKAKGRLRGATRRSSAFPPAKLLKVARPPSFEVEQFDRHCRIRYAKSKAKETASATQAG